MTKRNKTTATAAFDKIDSGIPGVEAFKPNEAMQQELIKDMTAMGFGEFLQGINDSVTKIEGDVESFTADELAALEAQAEADRLAAEAKALSGQADEEPEITEEDEDEAPVTAHIEGDLKEMIDNVTPDDAAQKQSEVRSAYSDRKDYEKSLPGLSSKMIPNLEATEKHLASLGVAALFCAIDLDPNFVNREVNTGKRFNVYALQKMQDIVQALGGGFFKNAINRAVLTSLFDFRDAKVPFTGQAALGAVSDKVKVDRAIAKHLTRHTVDAATASTQKSSTMTALQTLGIVTNSGVRGAEIWALTDTPQTRRLEGIIRKAA